MKTAFIFHGTAGYPEENWFPWLKEKLEGKGYQVFVPQFPTPDGQSLEAWKKVLNEYKKHVDQETVFVGHSLGGIFLLKLLEEYSYKAKVGVFVGTPIGVSPILNYDADSSFAGFDFDWEHIKNKSQNFIVFQSDTDPYVGIGNGEKLAEHLGIKLSFVPNAGHFNAEAGYTQFPELWRKIEPLL